MNHTVRQCRPCMHEKLSDSDQWFGKLDWLPFCLPPFVEPTHWNLRTHNAQNGCDDIRSYHTHLKDKETISYLLSHSQSTMELCTIPDLAPTSLHCKTNSWKMDSVALFLDVYAHLNSKAHHTSHSPGTLTIHCVYNNNSHTAIPDHQFSTKLPNFRSPAW